MAYIFTKVDTITKQDVSPLITTSWQSLLKSIQFPLQTTNNSEKIDFYNYILDMFLANPNKFMYKGMNDDKLISFNIGVLRDTIFQSMSFLIGPDKAGSIIWPYRADVAQVRYEFFKLHGITHVEGNYPSFSTIQDGVQTLACYEVISDTTQTDITIELGPYTLGPYDSRKILYLVKDPSVI